MKTCLNCNCEFPTSVIIDGKRRILSSRKYCFTCTPWGSHRTRPMDFKPITEGVRNCKICSKEYNFKKGGGMSPTSCGSCVANKNRLNKRYKLIARHGGKCQICGYSKCLSALEFHHKDPNQKEIAVTGNFSMERLSREADKCLLLCANCHREIHDAERISLRSSRLAERALDKGMVAGATPAVTTNF